MSDRLRPSWTSWAFTPEGHNEGTHKHAIGGDDIVVSGVVYSGRFWEEDGEGGVQPREGYTAQEKLRSDFQLDNDGNPEPVIGWGAYRAQQIHWPDLDEHDSLTDVEFLSWEVSEMRSLHDQSVADLTVVRAAMQMDSQGLPSPWEASTRTDLAHERLDAAAAAAAKATAGAPLMRAGLRSAATRVLEAEQRAAEAGIFTRRVRQREVERARGAANARSNLVLPSAGAPAIAWHRWVEDTVYVASVSETSELDQAKQDLAQARTTEAESTAWWGSHVSANVEARDEVKDALAHLSYEGGGYGNSNATEVYQREFELASAREQRDSSALANGMKDLSAATAATAGLAAFQSATVGVGSSIATAAAVFGADGDRTLVEVMGSPLEGLGARVDAIVAGPAEVAGPRPLEIAPAVRTLTA